MDVSGFWPPGQLELTLQDGGDEFVIEKYRGSQRAEMGNQLVQLRLDERTTEPGCSRFTTPGTYSS
jgi:hypothetical protein